MSTTTVPPPPAPPAPHPPARRAKSRSALLAHGLPLVWLNGGALAVCLAMILGLLLLIFYQGFVSFWPGPLVEVRTVDGKVYLGEVSRTETYRPSAEVIDALPEAARAKARAELQNNGGLATRWQLRTGNFDLTQTHFHWVSDFEIVSETRPEWALVVERSTDDGRFYGFPKTFLRDGQEEATGPEAAWAKYNEYHPAALERVAQVEHLRKKELGRINDRRNDARLQVAKAEMRPGSSPSEVEAARAEEQRVIESTAPAEQRIKEEIASLEAENAKYQLKLETADGQEKLLPLSVIVRAYPANRLGFWGKLGVYLSRWWEFVSAEPRGSNTEGGVWPAILGTSLMTVLMSLAVTPFGVIAALYLREYARAGVAVSAVRIAVNNLAGVPSIVFGVFGLGFFCYLVGGSIDRTFFYYKGAGNATFGAPGMLWASLTLALLTVPVVIVATEEALAAVPRSMREGSYACGASKWQTIRRIVLPRAMPGVLTGVILAMARGAGEVAPLMLVGVLKTASGKVVDGNFPYVHADRSFQHLGFLIYDVGFQSQNSEAAKPLVFTITMLLIVLVAGLNLGAMWLRGRLRSKYAAGQF
jgi:phosphate transport system permease protein